MSDLELNWKGKKTEVEKIVLPFQKIETVSISRTGKETLLAHMGQQEEEWKNKLIWGDNKYILASLLKDPFIAGKIKLIYIDPPFFTGTDMNLVINIGDKGEVIKEPSAIEEVAYRNMWKEGPSSFLQYMYERLKIMRDLLADDGSIFVRIDYHYGHYVKAIMDEIFGYENFRNEIIVKRGRSKAGFFKQFEDIRSLAVSYDTIFWYSKSVDTRFSKLWKRASEKQQTSGFWHAFYKKQPNRPTMQYDLLGVKVNIGQWKWSKDRALKAVENYKKYLEVAKKTNETLEEYFLKNGSNLEFVRKHGDTVQYWVPPRETVLADNNWLDIPGYSNFTGYPTENSEQLLQRVVEFASNSGDIVADFFCGSGTTVAVAEQMNRRWIGADIGRFSIHTIRKRLLDIPTCKPFEVLNMGKYERKYWASENLENYKNYVVFIIKLYNAQILENFEYIHGKKGSTAIHVGLVDSPVTKKEILDAIAEAKKLGFNSIDVLGWEWEMGLNDSILKEAKDMFGVNLSLRVIPREVMDKRAVDAGDIDFYELAHLDVAVNQDKKSVSIELKDFIIPNPELIPVEIQEKIKKFSDYIDYWAVDWDYKDVFHNEWQTYRSKDSPVLKLKTTNHQYTKPGRYQILIKVIDIFGNDTSTIREVVIK